MTVFNKAYVAWLSTSSDTKTTSLGKKYCFPIVALFEKVLGTKTILMGFGLDSDDIHSPNEHYGLFNFFKGIETIPYYYQYYTELKG